MALLALGGLAVGCSEKLVQTIEEVQPGPPAEPAAEVIPVQPKREHKPSPKWRAPPPPPEPLPPLRPPPVAKKILPAPVGIPWWQWLILLALAGAAAWITYRGLSNRISRRRESPGIRGPKTENQGLTGGKPSDKSDQSASDKPGEGPSTGGQATGHQPPVVRPSAAQPMEDQPAPAEQPPPAVKTLDTLDLINPYRHFVSNLAARQGKQVTFSAEDLYGTKISKEKMDLFDEALSILFQNAVVHGIESPERRIAGGKSAVGSIRVELSPWKTGLMISISDDGQGVDVEKVLEIAKEKGLLRESEAQTLPRNELLRFLFIHGFAHQLEGRIGSGRGGGLSRVKDIMEQLGSRLRFVTKKGAGTRVKIYIPQPH